MRLVLASGSAARKSMLDAAGLQFDCIPARVDEDAIRNALQLDGASPRTIADALADAKAKKVASKRPEAIVIGCDQVLDLDGEILSKPEDREGARLQLQRLSGASHRLFSAVVAYENAEPVWRHIGVVRLRMRGLSPEYMEKYLDRNWPDIGGCVGSYKLEGEGARFFTQIQGDYFTVLGLPLLDLLSWLILKGEIEA